MLDLGADYIYTLMNKDTPLVDFDFNQDMDWGGTDVIIIREYNMPWFIDDLSTWIQSRHILKHRAHVKRILSQLQLVTIKDLIDFTRGLSLTDALWVNYNMKYKWDDINLFDHEFSKAISMMVFDGGMRDLDLSHTTPEFTTEGSLAKCWIRTPMGVQLIKQGDPDGYGAGLEPYSEMYCADLLDVLEYDHVPYDVRMYQNHIVSVCPLFTSKDRMLLPFSKCITKYTMKDIVAFCMKHGIVNHFYELLIFDYLVLNPDRHLGNLGVMVDTDTFEIVGMAPIYDNGLGLLPKASDEVLNNPDKFEEYIERRVPKLYPDFFNAAKVAVKNMDTTTLEYLTEYEFERGHNYSLPEDRLIKLETLIQERAKRLLEFA